MTYTKSQLDALATTPKSNLSGKGERFVDRLIGRFLFITPKFTSNCNDKTTGNRTLKLHFPIYNQILEVNVEVESASFGFRDSTVGTINDILKWTATERRLIRKFLYEHAQTTKVEVDFGIGVDAPEHPCNFKSGLDSVEEKVVFDSIAIYETDGLKNRFALLNCEPEWEIEHGAAIIIRNGKPIAIGDFQDDLHPFDM